MYTIAELWNKLVGRITGLVMLLWEVPGFETASPECVELSVR